MKRAFFASAAVVLVFAACTDASVPTAPVSPTNSAAAAAAIGGDVIPGRFIVTLREGANPAAVARDHGVRPDFTYTHVLNGFAGAMSDAARSGLLRDARVNRVEPDGIARAIATTQSNATWGLDRIDQRTATLDGKYTYDNTATSVTAYIIDTGIRYDHAEFGGRASFGHDSFSEGGADCNGHGTHVAGTVGGATYGVAKGVKLVAVRVLNCSGSGTWSGVIAGMDWVTANHVKPAVANMSLGGGASSSVDQATQNMIAAGVATAVAAGNGNTGGKEQDACAYSPARAPDAMTIGATTKSDSKTSWSNYGSCVDWFAPGSAITSAWSTSSTATNTISGTSMAAPHVAGVAALYLQANPTKSAYQVRDALHALTTKGIVTNSKTANNHLLFSRLGGGSTANNPPVASFTSSCTNLACSFTNASTDDDGGDALTSSWTFGDGATSIAWSPSHTYGAAGTYSVTLTVSDGKGGSNSVTHNVTVTAGGGSPVNSAPTAAFSVSCSGVTCSFTDQSTDADGNITTWSWTFGNGQTSPAQNPPSVTYAGIGSYEVTLTVTDFGSLWGFASATVTCSMRGKSGKIGCQ